MKRYEELLDRSTEKVRDVLRWAKEKKGWAPLPFKSKMTSAESHLLYRTVKELGSGSYADVGVYRGASTVCIAKGLIDDGHHGTIYAVDLFEALGTEEGSCDNLDTPKNLQGYLAPYKNLALAICKGRSQQIGRLLEVPLKMAFIDADHSYEAVKEDIEVWGHLIVPNGILALHDTNFEGVAQAVMELSSEWEQVDHIYSMKLFRKKYAP